VKGSIIHDLPRYDRFLGGKGTLEIGYPWLSVGAILALEQVVFRVADANQPPKRVLEFGSGGSTIFFAKRSEHVTSIETDRGWAPRTAEALERNGLAGKVDLVVCTNPESERYVAALPDRSFDLLLVDHAADETVVGRGARHAFSRLPLALVGLPKLKPTGWLCVDNYALHGMSDFSYTGWETWVFDDMRYSGRGTLIARRRPGWSL
jgi:predicted O-methyltransferase YrrM